MIFCAKKLLRLGIFIKIMIILVSLPNQRNKHLQLIVLNVNIYFYHCFYQMYFPRVKIYG